MPQSMLKEIKDIADILQSFATVIAIVVGGIWSYIFFVRKRIKYPRASINHQILHKPISNGKVLLNVATFISNTGDVILSLASVTIRVLQMLPLPSQEIVNKVNEGEDPVLKGMLEIEWGLIKERNADLTLELEPGEEDQIYSDFIIDDYVQTVAVYSFFENVKKRGVGWGFTTVYSLKEGDDNGN